ncbi:MAG TPA: aminotransferase class III-fold pyridoxal phosphate-dependent enzyme [Candidatus Baltobacteraceae bacterium]|nr:aminotransferase class III-fold pyridoxal phosphate-dependent enzyme [Candidatus Baltobacteraceae bacterium]
MVQVRSRLWLPFTQMQSFDSASRTFVAAEGTELIDARGRRIFDAVSSIWTIVHGHCHPTIVKAIAEQAASLDHATTLGATNPVAERLASRLCAIAKMDYAFFASDGASAIEAAIKMALQYWQQRGEPQRRRFVRLVDAYHGDTAGAMSLSDIAVFKSHYDAITFEALPYTSLEVLDRDDVAAVIVEPIVQAAAGMRIVDKRAYDALADRTPLTIVDEIATGFGRTGTMFAHEGLSLRPDIVCVGKGLSGGALALSATLVRAPIYEAFLGAPQERKQFFHGHSFAGNPIACAAALASLELFEMERTLERAREIAKVTRERLERLRQHASVADVRGAGAMAGVELRGEGSGRQAADALYERGHFTRAIGEVVQFVPPLSTRDAQVHAFFDALEDALA